MSTAVEGAGNGQPPQVQSQQPNEADLDQEFQAALATASSVLLSQSSAKLKEVISEAQLD